MAQKPVFLTPIEVPEYCYLSEAISWIALGRVPAAEIFFEGEANTLQDKRFYWRDMPDNFHPHEDLFGFDEVEFQAFGVVLPEGYFRALDVYVEHGLHDIEDVISRYKESAANAEEGGGLVSKEFWIQMMDKNSEDLNSYWEEKSLVEQVDRAFEPFFELGWAKLFQRIREGSITLEGIDRLRWEKLADQNRYEEAAKFTMLDPSGVSLNLDWRSDQALIYGREYVSIRVQTSQICGALDTLNLEWSPVSTQRFGSFYRVMDATAASRRRGRPLRIDWQEVEAELLRLEGSSQLPNNKESCIFHLISYCEQSLGRRVGRSTIQRNMRTHLARIYD